MKILQMIWSFLKKKNNLLMTIIIVLLLAMGTTIYFQRNKIANLNDKYQTEVNLNNALNDTVSYHKNQYGEVVAEKLTLQTTVENLEKIRDDLTASEKELLERVKSLNNGNAIITAALIEAEAVIDSLLGAGYVEIDTGDSTITFTDTTEFLVYDIEIRKVIPVTPLIQPSILFKHFSMPNKQFVEFHWKDNKKLGYPIEFSVTNSNPYFKTNNISSYAIPEIKKEVLNPTGWQKVGKWFKKNGKTVIYIGAGAAIGAGGTYILMK